MGALPVHSDDGPRRGGSGGVKVWHQPRRMDCDQVMRILQELIKPTSGGGMFGCVFDQVAVLPTGVPGFVKEHIEHGAFIADLMPWSE